MSLQKHDLLHELPEHKETIHELKVSNQHFAKLFDEYHELDQEVNRIESGIENRADDYLEDQKKNRLLLKDQLYTMIREYLAEQVEAVI